MALDKNVQKFIVIDGGARDPNVGSQKIALYTEDGLPLAIMTRHKEQHAGEFSANGHVVQHNLGTMEPILFAFTQADGMFNPSYTVLDENSLEVGGMATAFEGDTMTFIVYS